MEIQTLSSEWTTCRSGDSNLRKFYPSAIEINQPPRGASLHPFESFWERADGSAARSLPGSYCHQDWTSPRLWRRMLDPVFLSFAPPGLPVGLPGRWIPWLARLSTPRNVTSREPIESQPELLQILPRQASTY